MLKGFKEFISKGNVIDLAVAVVIGSAFAAVVDTVVSSVVEPVVNSIGGAEVEGLGFRILSDVESTYVDFAAAINALIVFVITAAVVYFVFVLPMNKWRERKATTDQAPDSMPDVELLTEIRDLLKERDTRP